MFILKAIFWFLESGKSDHDCIESEVWFDVIKTFVISKEFKSLFTLKLLADTLYGIVGKSQFGDDRAPLKEIVDNTLDNDASKEYSGLLNLFHSEANKSDVTKGFNKTERKEEERTGTLGQKETGNNSDDESVLSNMSSSTVLFSLSEGGKDKTPSKADKTTTNKTTNDCESTKSKKSETDFFEGSDEDKNVTKPTAKENVNPNANKKDFFRSESNTSDISSTDIEKTNTHSMKKKKKRLKEKTERVDENKKEKETVDNNDTDESIGLNKLLKMTKIKARKSKRLIVSSSDEAEKEKKEEEEVQDEETKIAKQKKSKKEEEKESLLDYLNLSEKANCDVANNSEVEDENEMSNNYLTELNDEVKNAFLLSSAESEIGEDSSEDKVKAVKSNKKEKTKERECKSRRRDDLSKFKINFSDEDLTEGTESSGSVLSSLERMSESASNTENENKSWKKSKSNKRCPQPKNEIVLSDSNDSSSSEIEQISVVKSQDSPMKGRKNIQKIFKKESLQVETKQALKMETERKKRLTERMKLFEKFFSDSSRLVLDFDPETKKELVVVDENLSNKLKPHQKEGVKFMWNSCFESLERMKEGPGSGCILAHCMGLGKTLQVITLVHTILTHQMKIFSVMILCPLNTLKNWLHEFKIWLRGTQKPISVWDIVPCRTNQEKVMKVKLWKQKGGVLVLSYEMLRALIRKGSSTRSLSFALLDPGADVVVCDEGHVLKNENSALYRCVSQVKTLRRIILTGTPLQNNLLEYYCMVQFAKPNVLGTRKEFMNRFVNPINNGQFEDSTQLDVRIMKRRAHVLHTMLDGFIQRFGYYVLTPFLPEKQEYVVSIALTQTQAKLYRLFIQRATEIGCKSEGLFSDFSWLQKVWTHPLVLKHYEKEDRTIIKPERMKENWGKFVKESEYEDIRSSGKLILLFGILKKCYEIGDKILVFSQYLSSLNLIEHFLQKTSQNHFSEGGSSSLGDTWVLGEDYFRMDGSTSVTNRHNYCRKFNNKDNKRSRLFLISTRAGGLGINLVGANRVVIFDASWNPSHDVQSIFRVYRFGQEKPCYIYRFLAEATMEEKIYKRQVNKLSLAHRILDEHQIERHYTMGNLLELYRYEPTPRENWKVPKVPKDKLFAEILVSNQDIIVGYHEHDSLLENKEEEELTEEERRVAWEEFEKEKQPPGIVNGFSTGILLEDFRRIPMLKQAFNSVPPNRGVFNQSPNQLCKIVEVRTLRGQPESVKGLSDLDHGSMIEMGKAYGVVPCKGETINDYRSRLQWFMKTMFSWNNKKTTTERNENQIPSALN